MRGINMSMVSPIALKALEYEWAASENRPEPIQLWHNLSNAKRYQYLSKFMDLRQLSVPPLTSTDFALLMQWVLEQQGLKTDAVELDDNKLDLELTNVMYQRAEYARIYYKAQTCR